MIKKVKKCKVKFSQKQFLRKSCLATFITKVLVKNFIQRATAQKMKFSMKDFFKVCTFQTEIDILEALTKCNRVVKKQSSQHKKWSFSLRIYSVNVTNSARNWGVGHIYWIKPQWKTSFFVLWAMFFNNAITFSQVQTEIYINYCFCFCFYSFDRKNKSLYYAKVSLLALKGRERTSLSHDSRHPLKP